MDSQGAYSQRLLPYRECQSATALLRILGGWLVVHQWDMDDDGSGTSRFLSSPSVEGDVEKTGGSPWRRPAPLQGETPRSRPQSARVARPCAGCRTARRTAGGCEPSAAKRSDARPCTLHQRPHPFFLSSWPLHLGFNGALAFRASRTGLRALLLGGTRLLSWVPPGTTRMGWA